MVKSGERSQRSSPKAGERAVQVNTFFFVCVLKRDAVISDGTCPSLASVHVFLGVFLSLSLSFFLLQQYFSTQYKNRKACDLFKLPSPPPPFLRPPTQIQRSTVKHPSHLKSMQHKFSHHCLGIVCQHCIELSYSLACNPPIPSSSQCCALISLFYIWTFLLSVM